MKSVEKQMSESMTAGVLLAFTGGLTDAYTYICRGNVFANAQTGNIVLLGINAADGRWIKALLYFIPIVSFVLGVAFSELIKKRFKDSRTVHWRQIILGIEVAFLLGVGFIPSGKYDTLANISVAFMCSLQVQSFRKIKGNAYATTMCTGNLRSATENLFKYRQTCDKKLLFNSIQYYCVILIFIFGAASGAWLTNIFGVKTIWAACISLTIVFILMIKKPEEDYTDFHCTE